MGHVHFNLNNSGSLHTLASPQVGVSGTLPPNMQGANQGGLYLIVNTQVNGVNRYVGKTGNIEDRFNGRMLTIRRSDLRVLAACMGRSPEELGVRLEQLGLRAAV